LIHMAEENSRFIDNQDGTVTDVQTGLMWTREDTWLTEAQWVSWDEALRYTHDLSYRKFAGYNDWRLPEQEELLTLVDNEHTIK
ncbi:MAG: DUF1566 domain-containing protein, partial [Nitrospinaceae bacterium]|nr:DUF1566 domain-containing protein [Nitrospinaceae bacterium]NIR53725.1 DUF1566 domain-containing protein [Nitrospinaceae bacterium]NIS84133.1 DUF1566 domain-containing protein [Nitrospinaceae bacterium]NIU43232.1 DUF1566 domain-containing protein [Nitrospinaceae bacterium]NIU95327.1 DUF1566 domain-containing protein [Nitrospinaceae bacterium]